MAESLFHLGYVSTETRRFSVNQLVSLLNEARTANASRDITGLLLYREGSFYQVLEGHEASVMKTFGSIQGDHRHQEIEVLFFRTHGRARIFRLAYGFFEPRRFGHRVFTRVLGLSR